MLDFEVLCGQMWCDEKVYCFYGAEVDVFINFIWSMAIIWLYYSFYFYL